MADVGGRIQNGDLGSRKILPFPTSFPIRIGYFMRLKRSGV